LAEAHAKLPRATINSDLFTEEEAKKAKKKKLGSNGLKSTKNAPPLYKDVYSES